MNNLSHEILSNENFFRRKGFKTEHQTWDFLQSLSVHEYDLSIVFEKEARSMNSSMIFTVPNCKYLQMLSLLMRYRIFDYEVFDPYFTPEEKPRQRLNLPKPQFDPEIVTREYLSNNDANDFMDQMASRIRAANPAISAKVAIEGYSYEKRPIKSITIANKNHPNNTVIFIDAGIHAREWHSRSAALYLLVKLAEEAKLGEDGILSKASFIIVPGVNPDGYEFSRKGDKMWRKNRRPSSKDCIGIDGNRNYDIKWSEGYREGDPCAEVYRGPTPFSESETRTIKKIMMRIKNVCKMYISMHTYGNSILYPYGWALYPHPRHAELHRVAQAGATAAAKIGGSFKAMQSGSGLYVAAGGSDDYAIEIGIPFAYTFEIGDEEYGFALPVKHLKESLNHSWAVIKGMVLQVIRM